MARNDPDLEHQIATKEEVLCQDQSDWDQADQMGRISRQVGGLSLVQTIDVVDQSNFWDHTTCLVASRDFVRVNLSSGLVLDQLDPSLGCQLLAVSTVTSFPMVVMAAAEGHWAAVAGLVACRVSEYLASCDHPGPCRDSSPTFRFANECQCVKKL